MSATSIHLTALDGIVNVNSLFTLAVFIGLTWNPTDPSNSLIDSTQPSACSPGPNVAEDLVAFHVYSFSCFLFSSLVALGLKQATRLARGSHHDEHRVFWAFDLAHANRTALRVGYVVSAVGSVCGSVFLMLALVNVVQIKLGVLGCGGSRHGYAAVVPLVMFVPAGLLIYVCTVFYAFTR
ncbi:maternal effect embryo arrest 60 [Perilla frutescens var. hirtella]|uniref:Maternal effect embryo arrest 60 n=1 Tax=Perilla frutescens var. hirtella TaxID=608512 RepID=A0AAD4J4T6_PERFH|nr:maternal effect embryo arrest 60 [Perilla frutescens var. hirtella]KAH6805647.1 maternal effect embryo arrest 60 [Perilla frutescens var. frutescens]KAH6827206.1 maternal effect embryo arrest 60 [Perilla frutescens var. hirtella]